MLIATIVLLSWILIKIVYFTAQRSGGNWDSDSSSNSSSQSGSSTATQSDSDSSDGFPLPRRSQRIRRPPKYLAEYSS